MDECQWSPDQHGPSQAHGELTAPTRQSVPTNPEWIEMNDPNAILTRATTTADLPPVAGAGLSLIAKKEDIRLDSRATASVPTQSMLIVAQLMASNAMQGAPDHRIGYQLAKSALAPLLTLTAGSLPAIGRNG